jgi:hypothetical protein
MLPNSTSSSKESHCFKLVSDYVGQRGFLRGADTDWAFDDVTDAYRYKFEKGRRGLFVDITRAEVVASNGRSDLPNSLTLKLDEYMCPASGPKAWG